MISSGVMECFAKAMYDWAKKAPMNESLMPPAYKYLKSRVRAGNRHKTRALLSKL